MKLIHLVAAGLKGEIGSNNSLLWHIPEDLTRFKQITMGQSLLVGRKTMENMPPLLGRTLTVATRDKPLEEHIRTAIKRAEELGTDRVYIIGGGEIYAQTLDMVSEVLMTQVYQEYPEADTFYPQRGSEPDGGTQVNRFVLEELSPLKLIDNIHYRFKRFIRLNR